MTNKILCVVPCGKSKIWDKYPDAGPTPAQNVYIGTFSKMCQRYAKALYPDSWCILSAKYGFLYPNDLVPGPYEVSFNDPGSDTISISRLLEQTSKMPPYDTVVVVAGSAYVKICRQTFHKCVFVTPLEGCSGNGLMMSLMKKEIDKRNSSTLDNWM